MSKGSRKWTGVWDGLWTSEHFEKMKSAVYLLGYLLSRANKSGEVVTTYHEISEATGFPARTLGFWKKRLEDGDYISTKKTDGMVIKIANFRPLDNAGACHIGKARSGNSLPHQKTDKRQDLATSIQNLATSDAVTPNSTNSSTLLIRLYKTKRQGLKKSRQFSFSEADKNTANFILGKIQNLQPSFKEPNLESWANDVRLMRERDGRTLEGIKALFTWTNNNHFWRSNILSPAKLRTQWDKLEIQKNSNSNGRRSQADINSASSGKVVV